jgi:hypothetical protein
MIRAISHAFPSPQAPPDHPGPSCNRTARAARAWSRSGPPSGPHHPRRSRPHKNPGARPTRPISPQPPPSTRSMERETPWANDTDGSALAAQPDKSQGRPPKSPGSNAHRPRIGLPTMRSPREPLSRSPNPNGPSQNNNPREPFSCPEARERGPLKLRPPHSQRDAAACALLGLVFVHWPVSGDDAGVRSRAWPMHPDRSQATACAVA